MERVDEREERKKREFGGGRGGRVRGGPRSGMGVETMEVVEEGERRAEVAVREMLAAAMGERGGEKAVLASGGERSRAAEAALGVALAGAAIAGIVVARKWAHGRGRARRAAEVSRGVEMAGTRSDMATVSEIAESVTSEGVVAAMRAVSEIVATRAAQETQSGRSGDGDGGSLPSSGAVRRGLEWVEQRVRGLVAWLVRGVVYRAQEEVNEAEGLGWRGKRWVSMGDDRVRDSHEALDGTRVALGSAFMTQNGPIRYPGDRAAAVAEWISCRCHLELLRT